MKHGSWWIAATDSGKYVAGIGDQEITYPVDRDIAALIAIAPKLRDALRWALDDIEDSLDPDHAETLAAARKLVVAV